MQKYSFDKESGGSACQMAPLHLLLHARYIQGSFRRSWEQARTEGGLTRSGKYTGRGVAAAPSSTPARRPFVGEFGWTFHVSLTEDWSRPLSDRPSPGILVRRAGPPRASPSRPPQGTYETSGWPGSAFSPEAPPADWAPGWPT